MTKLALYHCVFGLVFELNTFKTTMNAENYKVSCFEKNLSGIHKFNNAFSRI